MTLLRALGLRSTRSDVWDRPRHRWIVVAVEFAKDPAGRQRDDGPYSGTRFREDLLMPGLQLHDKVTVDLRGTSAIGASFFDEAFGGLNADDVRDRLKVVSERTTDADLIWAYINKRYGSRAVPRHPDDKR